MLVDMHTGKPLTLEQLQDTWANHYKNTRCRYPQCFDCRDYAGHVEYLRKEKEKMEMQVVEKKPALQLEVGKTYRLSNGRTVHLIYKLIDTTWQFPYIGIVEGQMSPINYAEEGNAHSYKPGFYIVSEYVKPREFWIVELPGGRYDVKSTPYSNYYTGEGDRLKYIHVREVLENEK